MPSTIYHWLCSIYWWTNFFPSGEGPVLCITHVIWALKSMTNSCEVLVFSPPPWKITCSSFFLHFYYTNLYQHALVRENNKAANLTLKFGRGLGGVLCWTLSLQELTPQYRPKGTKTVLMETFLQHVSIKVQYQAFSSACMRYWITS